MTGLSTWLPAAVPKRHKFAVAHASSALGPRRRLCVSRGRRWVCADAWIQPYFPTCS